MELSAQIAEAEDMQGKSAIVSARMELVCVEGRGEGGGLVEYCAHPLGHTTHHSFLLTLCPTHVMPDFGTLAPHSCRCGRVCSGSLLVASSLWAGQT